jgi:hypothetical protein
MEISHLRLVYKAQLQRSWIMSRTSDSIYLRVPSTEMLRHVALVRADVSEKHSASIIRVTQNQ